MKVISSCRKCIKHFWHNSNLSQENQEGLDFESLKQVLIYATDVDVCGIT